MRFGKLPSDFSARAQPGAAPATRFGRKGAEMKTVSAAEWMEHRHDKPVSPNMCRKCRYSFNDVSEGWLCKRYDAKIKLSGGTVLDWPGQACSSAIKECGGQGYERMGFIDYLKSPLGSALSVGACATLFAAILFMCGASN